jgi:hypothetical protein
MPFWNEELQKWGYFYHEEVSSFQWLGISREIIKVEEDDVRLVMEMEQVKIKLDELKNNPYHDSRAISIAITHLETAMLWFANSRK